MAGLRRAVFANKQIQMRLQVDRNGSVEKHLQHKASQADQPTPKNCYTFSRKSQPRPDDSALGLFVTWLHICSTSSSRRIACCEI